MNVLIIAVVSAASLFLALVVAGMFQDRGPYVKAERQILQLERERNEAIVHGDAAALERMTADGYTFITLRGELRTKAELSRASGPARFTTIHAKSRNFVFARTETPPW